jgi:hypothetical protein
VGNAITNTGQLRSGKTSPGLTNPGSLCVILMAESGFGVSSMSPSCLVSTVQVGGCGVPPSNLQQLRDDITSAWFNIPVEHFRLVESMPRRIQAILEAKVGPTQY